MKDKKWVDCPSCGKKESMKFKKNISKTYHHPGYDPITVTKLDGYFCSACGEGILTITSNKQIKSMLAYGKALQDSKRVAAADLIDVESFAKKLSVTRQRIHQMIDEGKIAYVFVGRLRFPIRGDDKTIRELKKQMQK